jgi:hypothetical protein
MDVAIQDDIDTILVEQVLIVEAEALALLVVGKVGVVDRAAVNQPQGGSLSIIPAHQLCCLGLSC